MFWAKLGIVSARTLMHIARAFDACAKGQWFAAIAQYKSALSINHRSRLFDHGQRIVWIAPTFEKSQHHFVELLDRQFCLSRTSRRSRRPLITDRTFWTTLARISATSRWSWIAARPLWSLWSWWTSNAPRMLATARTHRSYIMRF